VTTADHFLASRNARTRRIRRQYRRSVGEHVRCIQRLNSGIDCSTGTTCYTNIQAEWENEQIRRLLIGSIAGAAEALARDGTKRNCFDLKGEDERACSIGDEFRVRPSSEMPPCKVLMCIFRSSSRDTMGTRTTSPSRSSISRLTTVPSIAVWTTIAQTLTRPSTALVTRLVVSSARNSLVILAVSSMAAATSHARDFVALNRYRV
jgi:hypothetical protein